MTATALHQLIVRAAKLADARSASVRAIGLEALEKAEKFLASGQAFDVELTCACCTRPSRPWLATGVADDYLHPLCSGVCVAEWRGSHQGARVLRRDGRDWAEQPIQARRAA